MSSTPPPKKIDNIISNISVRVYKAYHISQVPCWYEKKTNTVYTLWFVTKGRVWINTNGSTFTVEPGGVVLFYPNLHYEAYTDENGCDFMYLFFTLDMGSDVDLMADMNLSGIIPPEVMQQRGIDFCKEYLRMIGDNQQHSLGSYVLFLQQLNLILTLQRQDDALLFYPKIPAQWNSGVLRAMDYISKHYHSAITIPQLAQIANISEKRFINSFNYIVGTPPGKYITQCRMREAAEMLTTTTHSIREIATAVGYSDQYAFSKAFKRTYGDSPTAFRLNALATQTEAAEPVKE